MHLRRLYLSQVNVSRGKECRAMPVSDSVAFVAEVPLLARAGVVRHLWCGFDKRSWCFGQSKAMRRCSGRLLRADGWTDAGWGAVRERCDSDRCSMQTTPLEGMRLKGPRLFMRDHSFPILLHPSYRAIRYTPSSALPGGLRSAIPLLSCTPN